MMYFGGVCVRACLLFNVHGCRVCDLLCHDACWIVCVLLCLYFVFNVLVCVSVTFRATLYGLLLCVLLSCVFVRFRCDL